MILNIFGQKVPVIFEEGLEERTGHEGEYDYETHSIHIDSKLEGKTLDRCIFHEMLHALFHRTGVTHYFGENEGKDMEHLLVYQLTDFLFESFELKLIQSTDRVSSQGKL